MTGQLCLMTQFKGIIKLRKWLIILNLARGIKSVRFLKSPLVTSNRAVCVELCV